MKRPVTLTVWHRDEHGFWKMETAFDERSGVRWATTAEPPEDGLTTEHLRVLSNPWAFRSIEVEDAATRLRAALTAISVVRP